MSQSKPPAGYQIYKLIWEGLDLVFPPHCGGCGLPGARWCLGCQKKVRLIAGPVCYLCGRPMDHEGQDKVVLCWACRKRLPSFDGLRSWAFFEDPLRLGLHRIKYMNDFGLSEVFSRPLIDLLWKLDWQIDIIVPVPVGVARKSERGYNQASLMAFPIALTTRIPFCAKALNKVKDTPSQVGLTIEQRLQNVAGAFLAVESWVRGKSILLIDDICTSGATLNACTEALLAAHAEHVYALTLARANINHA